MTLKFSKKWNNSRKKTLKNAQKMTVFLVYTLFFDSYITNAHNPFDQLLDNKIVPKLKKCLTWVMF